MFKKIEPLSKTTHQDLRFTPTNTYDFASAVLNVPISMSEFTMASQSYPIIFPMEGSAPLLLLSLDQKNNSYVDQNGAWKSSYVPAHIRRYPFVLANSPNEENEDNFVVCIDREAPHFNAGQGDPLFTADGSPSDVTQNAINFLQKFQEEMKFTQTTFKDLEKHDLLTEKRINVEKDGQKTAFGGFRCVDTEKLNALDDTTLANWVRNGFMGLINTHLQSLANLKTLAMGNK
jgi:hypothetical protein